MCAYSACVCICLYMYRLQLEKDIGVCLSLSLVWLCDPKDCSLPGSSVHLVLQAGILEWVAMPFSRRERDKLSIIMVSLDGGGNGWWEGMITFFYLFLFFFISWRLITLQYCSGFCHTLKWISHGYTCVPPPIPPLTSPFTRSLWVFPVHQAWALVSCIQPGPFIFSEFCTLCIY